jgi:hypothetical protein
MIELGRPLSFKFYLIRGKVLVMTFTNLPTGILGIITLIGTLIFLIIILKQKKYRAFPAVLWGLGVSSGALLTYIDYFKATDIPSYIGLGSTVVFFIWLFLGMFFSFNKGSKKEKKEWKETFIQISIVLIVGALIVIFTKLFL